MGLPCTFAFSRKAGVKTDNDAVRAGACSDKTPLVLFGSYNERMYLAESRAAARSTSRRPSPAPSSAAHTGTPFMGYAGATYLVQEVCNALFDALFHILPLGTELDKVEATPGARCTASCPWDADAQGAARRAGRAAAGAGAHLGRQAAARRRRARRARRPATIG